MKTVPIRSLTPTSNTFLNDILLYCAPGNNNVRKEFRFIGLDNHAYTQVFSSETLTVFLVTMANTSASKCMFLLETQKYLFLNGLILHMHCLSGYFLASKCTLLMS